MKTGKRIAKIGLFALLGGMALAACSKGEQVGNGDGLIRLSAGLQATTKAAITGGNFTAAVGGWESAGAADYAKAKTWLSTVDIAAGGAVSQVALTPARYYSQDGAAKTYMKAWYPLGSLADDGTVTFAVAADYAGDGTDDVLLAPEVWGSALESDTRTLAFRHALTQLRFTVKGDDLFVSGSPAKVISIVLKGTSAPKGIDLTADKVIYDATGRLAVPGIDGSQSITTDAVSVGQPVMVPPYSGNTFTIDVTTSDVTYRDVPVSIDVDPYPLPGKAYTITLSFAGFGIDAQASVTPWDYSGTGVGDVTGN